MAKGFIIAATTALILVVMVIFAQNLSNSHSAELNRISQTLVSEKVAHTWSDIKDDIFTITNIYIEKMGTNITFQDSVPKNYSLADFLKLYSLFIDQYYKSPDMDIGFRSIDGGDIKLDELSSKIIIMPFNIEYGYDNWWKNNVFLRPPPSGESNLTAITMIYLSVNFTNAKMNCTPANPLGPVSCDHSSYKTCSINKQNISINLSFSDYQGRYYNFPQTCFDETFPNLEQLHFTNSTGSYYLDVEFGKLTGETERNGVALRTGYPAINVTTKLILNTTDFYINYLAQLRVAAVGYNTTRLDKV